MRWLSPDGLSIFWISFQGECLVMTRERETNIIMCCQSLLKMGLMTGRASRTHTRSGWTPMCLFIYGYASLQNKVCRIFAPTWHNRVKSHTGRKNIQAHTAWASLPKYCTEKAHVPIKTTAFVVLVWLNLASLNSSLYSLSLLSVYKHSYLTFMLLLFSSKWNLLDRLAHQDPDFTHLSAWGPS